MESFAGLQFDEEDVATMTSYEQIYCERECCNFLRPFTCYDSSSLQNFRKGGLINYDNEIKLLKAKHANYLKSFLEQLPGGFVTLDASRSWIIYWITHALYLLNEEDQVTAQLHDRIINTLMKFQNKTGGFAGGPQQISQGAPNYAAVLSLLSLGSEAAYRAINRPAMYYYFLRQKDRASGGFSIHDDGEVDSRGTYTILAIARLLNLLTPELVDGVADFLLRCQTYEGGFGGEPANEAHGGYNFCAVAGLFMLRQLHRARIPALESWLLRRQSRLEGGFQGRTNKLVDSCYSFWQGSAVAMVNMLQYQQHRYRQGKGHERKEGIVPEFTPTFLSAKLASEPSSNSTDLAEQLHCSDLFDMWQHERAQRQKRELIDQLLVAGTSDLSESDLEATLSAINRAETARKVSPHNGSLSCNQEALQRYITHCAQNAEGGGMRDKPGKSRDFYHSCYALSGLSVAQRSIIVGLEGEEEEDEVDDLADHNSSSSRRADKATIAVNEDVDDVDDLLPAVEASYAPFRGPVVYGDMADNLLQPTSCVFNISLEKLRLALNFFHHESMPSLHEDLLRAYGNGL